MATAVQIGTYFVNNYYTLLQQQPALVYQFYNEASTVLRIDGAKIETAVGLLRIHNLVLGLDYEVAEITAANCLDSWNRGVMVMVRGLLQTKTSVVMRRFTQTFFLAPQESGYFVFNDILYILEEEHMNQHPAPILAQSDYPANIVASSDFASSVSDYILEETNNTKKFAGPLSVQETSTVESYRFAEPSHQVYESIDRFSEPPQQVYEAIEKLDLASVREPTPSLANNGNVIKDPHPTAEVQTAEAAKHSYASVLRVAKIHPEKSVYPDASLNKMQPLASDSQSRSLSTSGSEKAETVEENTALEDEGEYISVYVGKIPPSITVSELEDEFKKFGKLRPDGVCIKSSKETGVLYAFVEYEDTVSVQNALKGSPVEINGHFLYAEGRRPQIGSTSRGRRGGRGRGGYYPDASRGQYGGRSSGRGSDYQENGYRDNNYRPRSNR